MDYAFVRVAAQAWMLVILGIRTQDMVSNENIVVSTLLNRLHKGADGTEIGADFGLRKDGTDFHNNGSLVRSFPLIIRRPDVGCPSTCPLRSLSTPVSNGVAKLQEVRCLRMGLERRLVLIDFVEPDAVGIIAVLDDIEPEATRLIAHGSLSILRDGGNELILEPRFDLDGCDDDVHKAPLTCRSTHDVTRRTQSGAQPRAAALDRPARPARNQHMVGDASVRRRYCIIGTAAPEEKIFMPPFVACRGSTSGVQSPSRIA